MNKIDRIECPFEQLLREAGYVEVYDGQTAPQKQSDQFPVSTEDRRFFTRFYQQVKNNHFTERYAKLVYNSRSYGCIECNIYKKAPDGLKVAQQKMVTQKA